MKKEMLINVLQAEECRIAIVENGVLEELYVERTSQESYVGNIYKGRIVNIEPSIQAAFVDFGIGRNGFLHVSDVDAKYYRHKLTGDPRPREGLAEMLDLPDVSIIPDEELLDDEDIPETEESDIHDHADEDGERPEVLEIVNPFHEETAEPPRSPREERSHREEAPPREDRPSRQERSTRERRPPPEERPVVEPPPPPVREELPPAHLAGGAGEDDLGLPPVLPWKEEELHHLSPPPPPEGRGGRRQGRGRSSRGGGPTRFDVEPQPRLEPPPAPVVEAPATAPTPVPPPTLDAVPPPPAPTPRRTFGEGLFDPEEDPALAAPPPAVVKAPESLTPKPMPSAPRMTAPSPEEIPVAPPPPPPVGLMQAAAEAAAALAAAAVNVVSELIPAPSQEAEPEHPERRERERQEPEPHHDEDHPAFKDEDQMEDHPHILGDHPHDQEEDDEEDGDDQRRSRRRRRPRARTHTARPKPPIQEIFRRGQEVLVQVIKEGLGTKGPTLSTYISIPGRYLVLMPGLNRIGVSRKIPDDEQRKKLREFLQDLKPPQGLGFIIRTAGLDRTKRELHRDLAYLTRLWKVVIRRIKKNKSPSMIYQESDIITRTIRDVFTSEIETIRVDEPTAYEHAQEFLQVVMPRYADRLVLDAEQEPFFHRYGLESEIARIQQRRLPLPQGGSIVIEQTEALVAIDVNSGNFRQDNDAEETAFRVNLTAAKEIARQLRLRDLGGVIIIDFIDMREEHHRREVERTLRDAVRRDRARTKILKMSQFGIVEMTRQRIRPSLKRSSFEDCPHCHGNGQVKTSESMSIEVMRWLQLAAHRNVNRVHVRVTEAVAQYLLNRKRKEIAHLEEEGKMSVTVFGSPHAPPEMLEFTCYDSNGGELKLNYPDTQGSRSRSFRHFNDRDRDNR